MKFKINKGLISQRATKRFKWMCVATLLLGVFNIAKDYGFSSDNQITFVDAGEDMTFEADDIYAGYIQSALVQKELMQQEQRAGQQTWSMDDQVKYLERRRLSGAKMSFEEAFKLFEAGKESNFDLLTDAQTSTKVVGGKTVTVHKFKDTDFESFVNEKQAQGFIEEYYDGSRCYSGMINNPGSSLLGNGLMGVAYLLFLGYLFLGISISADIFMEAIEVITSQTQVIDVYDEKAEQNYQIEVPIWNPTMANLTLMAFGSSAPEIILSVLEAVTTLGKPAGELGPSTIVGSAAFNLLVISGVSVLAVGGEGTDTKKIDDMGVFVTTGTFSVFAYIWLYICLAINTPDQVTTTEAILTFCYFIILLGLAFAADKYNQRKKAKVDNEKTLKENLRKMKKSHLRSLARTKGEMAILSAAQGQKHESMTEAEVQQVKELYMDILETNDLKGQSLDTLMNMLKPDTLFERFAARKANQVGATKEFLEIKGQKFQIENSPTTPLKQESELLCFKCLHYSVTESAGTMNVTILKKNLNTDCTFGIRTRESTAKSGKDFDPIDEVITMKKREGEKQVEIRIHDNQEWQPDMDFFIELYDTKNNSRLFGDDTECKITILDEDFPGKLGFEITEITASRNQDKVDIVIKRVEGTDGQISCMIRTEPLIPDKTNPQNAVEFEDYLPKHEKIEFAAGESEKIVPIYLVNESVPQIDGKDGKGDEEKEAEEEESEDDSHGPRFKVVLEKPEPDAVKISKKNCCTVELKQTNKNVDTQNEHTKMINYFVSQKNPTWGDQFKQAVMLCPQVDEDDLIVSDVSMYEALTHFACMGWKILFALIPPCEWGGGWPAFFVALVFIGGITAVVAEVATVLGCVISLEDSVTAITLVAMGTSLPDTFASMTAAQNSEFADSAIGNVTGSNSVNVFVGLGLPWMISSFYQASRDEIYVAPAGTLAFSVMLFLITSLTCFVILGIRRAVLGGELGGPKTSRYFSAVLLISLWFIYIIFSTLKAYKVIGDE